MALGSIPAAAALMLVESFSQFERVRRMRCIIWRGVGDAEANLAPADADYLVGWWL